MGRKNGRPQFLRRRTGCTAENTRNPAGRQSLDLAVAPCTNATRERPGAGSESRTHRLFTQPLTGSVLSQPPFAEQCLAKIKVWAGSSPSIEFSQPCCGKTRREHVSLSGAAGAMQARCSAPMRASQRTGGGVAAAVGSVDLFDAVPVPLDRVRHAVRLRLALASVNTCARRHGHARGFARTGRQCARGGSALRPDLGAQHSLSFSGSGLTGLLAQSVPA